MKIRKVRTGDFRFKGGGSDLKSVPINYISIVSVYLYIYILKIRFVLYPGYLALATSHLI